MFVKHYAPIGNKVKKEVISSMKVTVKVSVSQKGIISGVCMLNIKFLSLRVQNFIAQIKVDNRLMDRQEKNNMAPIYWCGA